MKPVNNEWFAVRDADRIDSPALLIYRDRVRNNIDNAIKFAGGAAILRPHVKTNKIAEVCRMMMDAGIDKFKCATIAEAEMLGNAGAKDVLIAYPLTGPKVDRFIKLMNSYPATVFSCLTDNASAAQYLSERALQNNVVISVFIDLNTGMNRSGIHPRDVPELFDKIKDLKGIKVRGLHAYDGHIRDVDLQARQEKSDAGFREVESLKGLLISRYHFHPEIVVGGTPTFSTHIRREQVQCSPGTFVFWDHGYKTIIPEQPFDYAALVMTRVISIIDEHTICADLGHKGIAAENPLPRMHFLNAENIVQASQSEEHLVLKVDDSAKYAPGDILYAVPLHICPTVALYERASVIEDGKLVDEWKVVARDRKITI